MGKSGVICSISIIKTTDENNKEKVVVVPQTVVVKSRGIDRKYCL